MSAKVGSQEDSGFQLVSSTTTRPLNVSQALEEWNIIKDVVLGLIAPYEQMSVFQASLVAYNLSSIRFAYFACEIP